MTTTWLMCAGGYVLLVILGAVIDAQRDDD